jgi:biopolymer transport protein TolQ
MEADITSQAVGLASNTDFSLWSLFLRADFIVKSVILMLIGCSIYSWAVIIEKFRLFKKINLESEEFEEKFWKSKSAETFYNSLPADVENPTALGLLAAIPAVVAYNKFNNDSKKYSQRLENFSKRFLSII